MQIAIDTLEHTPLSQFSLYESYDELDKVEQELERQEILKHYAQRAN